jgi:hypothetical protein
MNVVQLNKILMEAKERSGTPSGFKRILHKSFHELGGQGQSL